MLKLALAWILATLVLAAPAQAASRVIVGYHDGVTAAQRAQVRKSVHAHLLRRFVALHAEVVRVSSASAAIAKLERDPHVRYAELDPRIQLDPVRANAADLAGSGTGLNQIHAPQAWTLSTGAGVTVAVIDTGINYAHTDLQGRIAAGGYDFVDGDSDPSDENGHGTHVSATIAGNRNNDGVTGVAPDAQVLPLRALDADGAGFASDVVAAMDYAGQRGVRIVSMSLGALQSSQLYDDAVRRHPATLFIAAAGNADVNNDFTRQYPCGSASPNMVCVGATDASDAPATFSNFGHQTVDLFAPGVSILSAWIPGNAYRYDSGTSMATPHVAGVAALLAARNPALTAAQIKNALMAGVTPVPALASLSVSGGRLDAWGSLTIPAADTDADGVGDVWDDCPSAADPAQADSDDNGVGDACTDTDGDGVVDSADACVLRAGPHSPNGCPGSTDRDGDGIVDGADACPTLPGTTKFSGCPEPDNDADGKPDSADRCPLVAAKTASGCPIAAVKSIAATRCGTRCVRLRLKLSRGSAVIVVLQRRSGGHWKTQLTRTATLHRPSGTVTLKGKLAHGRYRAQVTAIDGAVRSRTRSASFHL